MEFFTAYNCPKAVGSPTGNGIEPVFELQVDKKTGVKDLVQVGETSLYDLIQASKDSADVNKIVERYRNTGDDTLLNKSKAAATYGDFVDLPKNLAENLQVVIDTQNKFNSLPVDIKKEFNNSYTEFLASYQDGSYKDKFAKFEQAEQVPTTQVVETTIKVGENNE